MSKIVCFVHGCSFGNPGPSAGAVLFEVRDEDQITSDAPESLLSARTRSPQMVGKWFAKESKQVAELLAIELAIQTFETKAKTLAPFTKLVIKTDSKYARSVLKGETKVKSHHITIDRIREQLAQLHRRHPTDIVRVPSHTSLHYAAEQLCHEHIYEHCDLEDLSVARRKCAETFRGIVHVPTSRKRKAVSGMPSPPSGANKRSRTRIQFEVVLKLRGLPGGRDLIHAYRSIPILDLECNEPIHFSRPSFCSKS